MSVISLPRLIVSVYFPIVALLSTLLGCASAPPTIGPRAETSGLESVAKIPLSAALLLSNTLDNYKAKQNASGFFGGACQIEMSFGPIIAKNGVAEFGRVFNSVVPTTDPKVASAFDLIIETTIEGFLWRATSLSSDAAAIKIQVTLKKANKILWQESFQQEEEGELGRIADGCDSALETIGKASASSIQSGMQSAIMAISKNQNLQNSLSEIAGENKTATTNSIRGKLRCASGQAKIIHKDDILTVSEVDAIEFLYTGFISEYQCLEK